MLKKLVFGVWMMKTARDAGIIPPEQFSETCQTVQEGKLLGTLFWDLSRQRRRTASI